MRFCDRRTNPGIFLLIERAAFLAARVETYFRRKLIARRYTYFIVKRFWSETLHWLRVGE